jgi:V/A-type H+/Na+-transporting ATPase subunit E
MGIEEVRKEIMDNARNQAKEILKEGEKEKKGLLASAETRVEQIREKLEKEAEKQIEQYKAMTIAEAASQSKRQKLALEKQLLSEVFEEAKLDLDKLSPKKREQHLKKLMSAEFSYSKIYCSKKDVSIIKKHKPLVKEMLGGVLLENKDGDIRVDLSYETLLGSIKQDKVAEITKILF